MFTKGYTPWNKGKTVKDDSRIAKLAYWKGKKNTNGFKKGCVAWNTGIPCKEETKRKIRESKLGKPSAFKGRKHTEEAKRIIGLKGLGRTAWNKGTKGIMKPNSGSFTSEKMSGKKHPGWNGGTSKLPYHYTFNGTLKRQVKERDNYTCELCNVIEDLTVHHINYDKMDCRLENLITLCRACNTKVNFKRSYWQKLITCRIKKTG